MIHRTEDAFVLHTAHTTYAFRVMDTGHLEHLYYGRKINIDPQQEDAIGAMTEKHAFEPGNTVNYDNQHKNFSLEDQCLEMSSYGRGDIREPFVEITYADGSMTSDYLYVGCETATGKTAFETMPGSYDETDQVEHLTVYLTDRTHQMNMELHYYVYADCDVITRMTRLSNASQETVQIDRLLSNQLDLQDCGYILSTFTGAWAREMKRTDIPMFSGKYVVSSYTGTSSSRSNPFFMLAEQGTGEDWGNCFGFNLIYSGNHYACVEVGSHSKTRVVSGINPQSFGWTLRPGESFETPEAVMTFSHQGYNGMSQHMHCFVREHIVRGEWKKKERPVLLNSWEAAYFDINEKKLLNLAKAGKDVGIELFVMDDGWFGSRGDDTQSLGDWEVNQKKLPGGLKGLADKVLQMGMAFGIWVEPEMVNVKSSLYEQHPDWAMEISGQEHSEGRNQRILDLANPQVQDFIIEKMTQVFSSAPITYVKWDMNRIVSDLYSPYLAGLEGATAQIQKETMHRYQMGLYRCLSELTSRFPQILFEGCSAGGNRFDLGILCYCPQIWGSDDTDAVCRTEIQTGYSYGYPLSVVSAHVSASPNHQTLRISPLETRFHVACFGSFGYECNLCDMNKEDLESIRQQIILYKEWRSVLSQGNFYRGRTCMDGRNAGIGESVLAKMPGNVTEWTCVSPDKKRAVGFLMQKLVVPNVQYEYYRAKGLAEDVKYHFYNRQLKYNVKHFGDLVNTVSPVHIRQDSLVHNVVSKFVKMDGEIESYELYGDELMYSGVKLKQSYSGTGYSGEVRYFQDFGSRLYFMEAL